MAKNQKITWAQAFRDILIEAIRRGQLLALSIAIILIIMVVRMPATDLPQLGEDLIHGAEKEWIFSYVLNLALLMLWFGHSRSLRRRYEAEFERLAQERNQLQEKLGINIKSSNN